MLLSSWRGGGGEWEHSAETSLTVWARMGRESSGGGKVCVHEGWEGLAGRGAARVGAAGACNGVAKTRQRFREGGGRGGAKNGRAKHSGVWGGGISGDT